MNCPRAGQVLPAERRNDDNIQPSGKASLGTSRATSSLNSGVREQMEQVQGRTQIPPKVWKAPTEKQAAQPVQLYRTKAETKYKTLVYAYCRGQRIKKKGKKGKIQLFLQLCLNISISNIQKYINQYASKVRISMAVELRQKVKLIFRAKIISSSRIICLEKYYVSTFIVC